MSHFTKVISARPRVHPLFLSLTEAIRVSEEAPQIDAISENDPKLSEHIYYTSPELLPPLDIHLSDQNGTSPASIQIALRSR